MMKKFWWIGLVCISCIVWACSKEEAKEEKVTEVSADPVVTQQVPADSTTQVLAPTVIPQEQVQTPIRKIQPQQGGQEQSKITPPADPFKGSNFTAEVIHTEGIGWGYDLYIDGKKTIHQPHIPGVAGTKGFSSKENAQKAANFVLFKLKNNIMPPSVSKEELDSLGVLK
jgi:hypothetical protein